MGKTSSREELLQSCVHDLHEARRLAIRRVPSLIAVAGAELAAILGDLRDRYAQQSEALASLPHDPDEPDNLWMAGVLDDAERDTRTVEGGALLDTALIGAVRKGIAADEVSLETAECVAAALGCRDEALFRDMRATARRLDERLQRLLRRLA